MAGPYTTNGGQGAPIWNDPGTWDANGVPPSPCDNNVTISVGDNVTLNENFNLSNNTLTVTLGSLFNVGPGITLDLSNPLSVCGDITENNGTITNILAGQTLITNNWTVTTNDGIVTTNQGLITTNNGTITDSAANGRVETNNFSIVLNEGLVIVNSNTATINTNNSFGSITTNNGTVTTNEGLITNNSLTGIISENTVVW